MEPVTGFLYIEPLYAIAFNILIVFYRLLGENLGVAIIAFTLFLKFITLPLGLRQIKNARKSQEFQTKYKELQSKHKDDKEVLTQELAKLQSQYLPAQLGGCLQMILQLLFFFQVYYVVINILKVGTEAFNAINYPFIAEFASDEKIHLGFLGLNLGKSATSVGLTNYSEVWPYIILIALVGITQFISGRVISGFKSTKEADEKAKAEKAKKAAQSSKDEAPSFSDAMQQSSKQMLYIFPIMTMVLGVSFPAGVALYWTVNSGFAIIQQLILHRQELKEKLTGEHVAEKEENKKKPEQSKTKDMASSQPSASKKAKKKKKKKKK